MTVYPIRDHRVPGYDDYKCFRREPAYPRLRAAFPAAEISPGRAIHLWVPEQVDTRPLAARGRPVLLVSQASVAGVVVYAHPWTRDTYVYVRRHRGPYDRPRS